MKRCARCGALCADSDTYCGVCGAPLHTWGSPSSGSDGLAIASMVLGIVGVCLFWAGIGIITAILAVIFGLIVLCSARRRTTGKGMAIAGLATGAGALLAAVLTVILLISLGIHLASLIENSSYPDYSYSDNQFA